MPPVMPEHVRKAVEAQLSEYGLARIVDYLLVTTDSPGGGRTPAGSSGPVALAADIQIERLDKTLAGRLLRATELRGENFDLPGHDPVVHAYVREVWVAGDAPPKTTDDWDPDGRLYECLVLSRLCATTARRASMPSGGSSTATGPSGWPRWPPLTATSPIAFTPASRGGSTSARLYAFEGSWRRTTPPERRQG
jgi:hypothetical protein